jgi:hypothetical protein
VSHEAKRRPEPGEIWLALTKDDGVQVDSILIDQAEFGQAVGQLRASHLDLPLALGPTCSRACGRGPADPAHTPAARQRGKSLQRPVDRRPSFIFRAGCRGVSLMVMAAAAIWCYRVSRRLEVGA